MLTNFVKHLVKICTSLQYIFTVFWALQKVGGICKPARATSADGAGKSVHSSNRNLQPLNQNVAACVSCHDDLICYVLNMRGDSDIQYMWGLNQFMYVVIIISTSDNQLSLCYRASVQLIHEHINLYHFVIMKQKSYFYVNFLIYSIHIGHWHEYEFMVNIISFIYRTRTGVSWFVTLNIQVYTPCQYFPEFQGKHFAMKWTLLTIPIFDLKLVF